MTPSDKIAHSEFKKSTSTRAAAAPAAFWGDVPPSKYKEVYGSLPPVTNETFFRHLFANGVGTHAVPLTLSTSINTWPGLWSQTPEHAAFQRELVKELNKNIPPTVDSEGFTSNGIMSDFSKLLTCAGVVSNPMSYVTTDNKLFRAELGLRNEMLADEVAIFKEVFDIAFEEADVVPINVTKLSQGGMRRFSRDVGWKLSYAAWIYEEANCERFLDAVWNDDHLTLANEFETCIALYMQKRVQQDTPGKKRLVFDIEYARSGGARGKIFEADNSVRFGGVNYGDMVAGRARNVQAGPWTVNALLQSLASSTLYSLFRRFPSVFHVNTPEQLEAAINGMHVYFSDVKEFDRSIPAQIIELFHERMALRWDERLVKLSRKLFVSPYYSRPVDRDGERGQWVGDPRDPESELFAGNRSGHALTSLFNKLVKVAETLCVLRHLLPVSGRCRQFLEGKAVFKIINNGDDSVDCCADKALFNRFVKLRENKAVGLFDVQREVGSGFSGMLATRQSPDDTNYKVVSKVHTALEKMWVPERSIGGNFRAYWTIGFIDRITNITKTDVGRAVWDIHMSTFRRTLGGVSGDFMSTLMREHAKLPLASERYTPKDNEVLEDSSKIHYKFSPDEISPDVLKIATSKIPPSVNRSFVKRYFKGKVNDTKYE